MRAGAGDLGTILKLIPPRSVLQDVPGPRRRRLCELHAFFMENFELNGGGKKFSELIVSLTKDNPQAFETLHRAAIAMSHRRLAKISSLAPEELEPLIRHTNVAPAFFLSVLKALENQALPVDGALVQALASFHDTIFESAYGTRSAFAGGVSMAMLENPGCTVEWLTTKTAHLLASLANNLWNGKEFGPKGNYLLNGTQFSPRDSFGLLAKKLSNKAFSPTQLQGMVNLAADPETKSLALQ